ncbi:MAG: hypothetical protein ACRERE_15020 [Candidatus Entotheonellia bacterium]
MYRPPRTRNRAAQDLVGQFVVGLDPADGIPTSPEIEAWLIA